MIKWLPIASMGMDEKVLPTDIRTFAGVRKISDHLILPTL